MKTCYLDSNLLIYYKNEDAPQYQKASEILVNLRTDGFTFRISPLVLDEFLYAFAYILKRKKVKDIFFQLEKALKEILDLPSIQIINPTCDISSQLQVVKFMEKYQLSPRDAYHLLIIKVNKIDSFATFDADFKKVFSLGAVKKV